MQQRRLATRNRIYWSSRKRSRQVEIRSLYTTRTIICISLSSMWLPGETQTQGLPTLNPNRKFNKIVRRIQKLLELTRSKSISSSKMQPVLGRLTNLNLGKYQIGMMSLPQTHSWPSRDLHWTRLSAWEFFQMKTQMKTVYRSSQIIDGRRSNFVSVTGTHFRCHG